MKEVKDVNGIKRGDILSKGELESRLRSGRGVVVQVRGANYFAVEKDIAVTDEGKKALSQLLTGAMYNNEKAFLVINENGVFTWEKGDSSGFYKKGKVSKPDAYRYPPPSRSQIRV
jgi:hypothetical protein